MEVYPSLYYCSDPEGYIFYPEVENSFKSKSETKELNFARLKFVEFAMWVCGCVN